MRKSDFCWAPPGQRDSAARRHIPASFLGCVPVLSLPVGHYTLEEVLAHVGLSESEQNIARVTTVCHTYRCMGRGYEP